MCAARTAARFRSARWCTCKQITGPEFILRFNEYTAAQLNITGAPGYSSGQVRAALEEVFNQTMPAGMGFAYSGHELPGAAGRAGHPAWVVFGLSLLFVFLILAALYESWTLPFSVLLSTPVAILGAYLALSLRSLENDIFATIGLIMLIGLSAKNAILIVEFAVVNYKGGQSISEAALGAARLRFRPIVMTALAFIFGCLPLWTASGSGAVSRRILGTVVIGGMLLATVVGILMIPVTFAVVEYLSHRFVRGGKGTTMDSTHPPESDEEQGPGRFATSAGRRSRMRKTSSCLFLALRSALSRQAVLLGRITQGRRCRPRPPIAAPITPRSRVRKRTRSAIRSGPMCFASRSCRT